MADTEALADCTEEFPHRAPYRVAHLAPVLPPNAEVSGGRRPSAALPGCAEPAGKEN